MEKTVDILVRDIPDDLYDWMKSEAKRRQMSLNAFALMILEETVKMLEKEEEEELFKRKIQQRLEKKRKVIRKKYKEKDHG